MVSLIFHKLTKRVGGHLRSGEIQCHDGVTGGELSLKVVVFGRLIGSPDGDGRQIGKRLQSLEEFVLDGEKCFFFSLSDLEDEDFHGYD